MKVIQENLKILNNIKRLANIDKKNFIDILVSCLYIIIDTREKKIDHILKCFDQQKISYVSSKLSFGDYSFFINFNKLNESIRTKYSLQNLDFSNLISVERKSNLDEIIQNFVKNRDRFEREFKRSIENNATFRVIIEDSYYNLITNNYISKVNKNSIVASIFTFESRYNTNFIYLDKECTASYIYNYFRYYLYNNIN